MSERLVSKIKPKNVGKKPDWNNKTAESYIEGGFDVPEHIGLMERQFLAKVGNTRFEKTVTRIIRLKAIDYDDPQKRRKEYIVYTENWYGTNQLGKPFYAADHIEGKYFRQLSVPIIDENTGAEVGYERSGQVEVYYIEFSPEKVLEIIEKSIGSDAESINFTVKVSPTMRHGSYTLEQFLLPWDDVVRLAQRTGGASMVEVPQPQIVIDANLAEQLAKFNNMNTVKKSGS